MIRAEQPDERDPLLHVRLAQVAARTPDAVALASGERQVTYGSLNRMADRLADRLRAEGASVEDIVAISTDRGIEAIAGIFAVLKVGAAYLPLDATYPRDRLQYMLADSGARFVLITPGHTGRFQPLDVREIELRFDDDSPSASSAASAPLAGKAAPAPAAPRAPIALAHGGAARTAQAARAVRGTRRQTPLSPDNLAYLIYTSGSTGRPKGIMISHGAVANHVRWRVEAFELTSSDVLLQRTPLSFDISAWEIFGALLTGCRLVLPRTGGPQETAGIADAIVRGEVTSLEIVPSILKLLLQEPRMAESRSLRYVFAGGEALPPDLAAACRARLWWSTVVNVYGPTETTIWTTSWICGAETAAGRAPIGYAIAGSSAVVLDAARARVPAGQEGTLFIGGVGLARGYWRRPDLTAAAFRPDPDAAPGHAGARLYNTGDIVRAGTDGALDFIGRTDSQIKLRGFRIELQEIEQALKACPLVADGLIQLRTDPGGDRKIVAYYVLRAVEHSLALNAYRHTRYWEVREFLASRLPHYMVPHRFRNIDEIPLLPNGKVNLKALPEPAHTDPEDRPEGDGHPEPRDDKERLLVDIWKQVLGVPSVDCNDRFAWLGGDSLQMIQVRLLAQRQGLFVPATASYHASLRYLATLTVWTTEPAVARTALARELTGGLRLFSQTKLAELRDRYRQWQTARLERPDRERFQQFYARLANPRDVYYLFVPRGQLHWLAKQLEFCPEDLNLVIIGSALPREEQDWIRRHVPRPFFHAEMAIDDNTVWELLFETNQHNFGWLELGCFVNNSALFRELTRMDDDVAVNTVYTHTERHRLLFMEFLMFVSVRAVQAVRARARDVSPCRYSSGNEPREGHRRAFHRVPRAGDRALVERIVHGAQPAGGGRLRRWLAAQHLFALRFYIGHLFYLHAQELGFRMKRVRNLTSPSDVTGFHNFFSDEVITALHCYRYPEIYRGDKFAADLSRTLQASYALLRSMVGQLPPWYRTHLGELEAALRERGVALDQTGANVRSHLTRYGVSPQVFERPQWRFLHEPAVDRAAASASSPRKAAERLAHAT